MLQTQFAWYYCPRFSYQYSVDFLYEYKYMKDERRTNALDRKSRPDRYICYTTSQSLAFDVGKQGISVRGTLWGCGVIA